MTFDDIRRANESIRLTPIKEKDYAEVPQRIKAFRMICPNGSIVTEMLSNDGEICIFKATVSDDNGMILGTGTAFENKNNGFINKTSYIENCETSAVGRALAMCGFGIDLSIASYEEVANAIENQKPKEKDERIENAEMRTKILKYVNRHGYTKEQIDAICKKYGVKELNEMKTVDCKAYIKFIESKGGNIDE